MNNPIYRIALVLMLSLFIFLSGCSKKSDSNPLIPGEQISGAGSVTLNGGGYNNTTINFGTGLAAYSVTDQITNCILYGKSGNDSLLVVVAFAGTGAGDYQWEEFTQNSSNIIGVAVNVYNSTGNNKYFLPKSGGKTNVSKYGTVGQTIEGTFNGSTQEVVTSTAVTVSGSFKASRVPDE